MNTYSCRFRTLVLLVACLAGTVTGQTMAQLSGGVTDGSGASVPQAPIVLRNTSTGVTQTTQSNGSGIYTFPFVPPGPYELTCELAGFRRFLQTGIVMETGSTRDIDIRLELSAITESMTVVASSPLLDAETSSVGQFIERTTVANMPVESRRVASLIRLMGNVVYKSESQGEAIPSFAMAGGRGGNQMWNLDGAVAQNMTLGVSQLTLNPPVESLQEFKAEANNFSAEFGRAGGGMIIMTTRSGTNQFHGSVYEFLRNDKFDARSFFAAGKAPLRYNIFGASLGGPIRRDKTFFFANFEGARRREGQTISNTTVPFADEKNGNFSARNDVTVKDPLNKAPFPGNIIPASRFDPLGAALIKHYPDPNVNIDPTRAPSNNYLTNVSDKLNQNSITAKFDHLLNDKNRFSARFSYIVSYTTTATVFPVAEMDFRGKLQDNDSTSIAASWIRNIGSTAVNEFRGNYTLRSNTEKGFGVGSNLNTTLGLKGSALDPTRALSATVTGLSNLGTGTERLQLPIQTRQIADTLYWSRGKHQLKMGGEFRYSMNHDVNKNNAGGRFGFNNRATGSGTAELLLGWTNNLAINSTDIIVSRSDFWGAFIQDDWKVSDRLTLNIGLRWDMDTPRWAYDNHQSGFDPKAINPVSGTPGIMTFAGLDGVSKYAHNFDRNNFGPRFGFAWRAGSKTVLRGGYGIAYNGEYGIAAPFVLVTGFGTTVNMTSSDGGFTPIFLLQDGVPEITRPPLGPGFGAVAVGKPPTTTPQFFAPDHPNGYAQQWNFTVQRQLSGTTMLELAYLANVGHKLGSTANMEINSIPLVNGRGPAKQDQKLRPYPQFSGVTWLSPAIGDSAYHALNVKIEKRYSSGLNFMSTFTFSKYLDNANSGSDLGGNGINYQHMELHALDKSMSNNDVPKRWISSAVYELPFGRNRRWNLAHPVVDGILGGWGLSIIADVRDGAPWGVAEQTNTSNTFGASQRPNLLQDPNLPSGRPRADFLAEYFDTSAFAAPLVGTFGSAARNLGYGPGYAGFDASVHKNWTIAEGKTVQFRTDFFNAPNRPQFGQPGMARGSGSFGKVSTVLAGSQRILQMSLRMDF